MFYDNEKGSLVSYNIKVGNNQTSDVNHMDQLSDLSFMKNQVLKKIDRSFSRLSINEHEAVDYSQMTLNSGIPWSTLKSDGVIAESNVHFDTYLICPSISHDQLFSIIDFSPNWTYTELRTKVHVKGKFLMNKEDAQKYSWSCMFGEIEVPADILADGMLCCHAPSHKPGRVPFYVTRSNRLACSEIRDFEYKTNKVQKIGNIDSNSSYTYYIDLPSRFENLLLLENVDHSSPDCNHGGESHANCTICSMRLKVDALLNLFKHGPDESFSDITPENRWLEESLRRKLYVWLLHKAKEDGVGLHVLDNEGQGVLHLAAALGYDWAIQPIISAGFDIKFRDLHGWTALHWAASSGREKTVVILIALDASPEVLTDPTLEFPFGRTPAFLAFQNGFKKIADYLQMQTLLKDSPSAVRNGIGASALMYQVFRL